MTMERRVINALFGMRRHAGVCAKSGHVGHFRSEAVLGTGPGLVSAPFRLNPLRASYEWAVCEERPDPILIVVNIHAYFTVGAVKYVRKKMVKPAESDVKNA